MQAHPSLFPEFELSIGAPLCAGVFSPSVIAEAPEAIRGLPDADLEEKIVKAKAVLKWVMARFRTAFSTSFGKDSSATLGIALAAAAELVREGAVVQPFVVLTADTLVENPSVHALALREMAKVRGWIERYKLPATTHVARPNLSSQFAVAVIGGRALPSLAGHKRDCTSDLKSAPLSRVRKAVLGKNDLPAGKFVVSITGVRKAESVVRATNVARRKESDVAIVQTNEDGNVALAPILGWDWDDVFGYLGLCANGLEQTYSDMRDVIDTYREATGECVIASSDEEDAKSSKPCQSRFGCWNCLQVKDDRSMDQMVQEPQHAYMKPLARFRTFLKNTFYDLSRRTWVGRTIDENGYIRFAVDGYSPSTLQELLKYALTIDIEERESAARLGIAPRYQIVSLQALFAICASWSSQGFSRPFEGLRIYSEIEKGARYPVPDIPEFPKVPIPPARYIKVGKGWSAGIDWQYAGLRDVMIDGFGGDGCIGQRQIVSKGERRIIMDVNTGPEFSIDPEGAALFMMFEMERYVEEWHGSNARKPLAMEGLHVAGVEYRTYVSYGFLSVAKGQEAKVDEIMRRTAWRERLGLAGYQYEHERALAMSVEASVPEIPSQEEVESSRRAGVVRTRRNKRDALQQKRINLQQLYSEWAPDVPWRHMVKNGQLPMVALPRNRKGRLVLRHLITPYRLADFLSNNPFVVARVRAHRGKKQVGQTMDLFRLAA
jgi:3'-phosphoadenosine 5'-phosphosulfate sulfotransferase (PAPS reductase)/FAD synthetase